MRDITVEEKRINTLNKYSFITLVATGKFSGHVMLLYVEKKSSQEQIYQFAKEVGAKWIVVNSDHYKGNNKGYYQDVESFRSSTVFHWNVKPEDRGAISVYVTDIDIPAAVSKRIELQREIARLDYDFQLFMKKIETDYPLQKIDKRWGVNNPKRLTIEELRDKRREAIKNACEEHDKNVAHIKSEMISTNFVSSTFIELSL